MYPNCGETFLECKKMSWTQDLRVQHIKGINRPPAHNSASKLIGKSGSGFWTLPHSSSVSKFWFAKENPPWGGMQPELHIPQASIFSGQTILMNFNFNVSPFLSSLVAHHPCPSFFSSVENFSLLQYVTFSLPLPFFWRKKKLWKQKFNNG